MWKRSALVLSLVVAACGDGGNNNNNDPVCGDGVITAPEQCDDGNQAPGDGCEADCTFTVECDGVAAEVTAFCNEVLAGSNDDCIETAGAVPADFCATSLSANIFPILVSNATGCSGCHQGAGAPASFAIDPASASLTLSDALLQPSTESPLDRISALSPEESYLLHKLLGTQTEVGGFGAQMPLGRDPVCASDAAAVCFWIATGALDN